MVHRKYRDDYFHHHYLESKGYPFYPADMSTCQRAGDLISRNNSSTTLPFFRVWTMDAETWSDWPQLSRRASGDDVHSVFATSQSSLWGCANSTHWSRKRSPLACLPSCPLACRWGRPEKPLASSSQEILEEGLCSPNWMCGEGPRFLVAKGWIGNVGAFALSVWSLVCRLGLPSSRTLAFLTTPQASYQHLVWYSAENKAFIWSNTKHM